MAIALVQHVIDTTSGATPWQTPVGFTSNITAGNLVCGFVSSFNANSMAVSDGTNNYTASAAFSDVTDSQFLFGFYLANVSAGAGIKKLTFTQTSGNFMSSAMMEFSGVATSSALNGSIVGAGNSTAGTSQAAGTSIGVAGNLIVSGIYLGTSQVPSVATLTPLDSTNNANLVSADAYQLSAAGAINPTWTFTSSGAVVVAMAFNPPGGAAVIHNLPLLGVGNMIGWTPSLGLGLLGGAAVKLGQAIRRNANLSRRRFLAPK